MPPSAEQRRFVYSHTHQRLNINSNSGGGGGNNNQTNGNGNNNGLYGLLARRRRLWSLASGGIGVLLTINLLFGLFDTHRRFEAFETLKLSQVLDGNSAAAKDPLKSKGIWISTSHSQELSQGGYAWDAANDNNAYQDGGGGVEWQESPYTFDRDIIKYFKTLIPNATKYAYVTLLSSDNFLPGTLVLIESLHLTSTKFDILVLVVPHISHRSRAMLAQSGAHVLDIDYITNPHPEHMRAPRQLYNFSKLRAWQLIQYERLVFLDSDILVLKSLDSLFSLDMHGIVASIYTSSCQILGTRLAAVQNFNSPFSNSANMSLFNSGLLVLDPSLETFKDMATRLTDIHSYNGGDQGFLNIYFSNWTELDMTFNFNKIMLKYSPETVPPWPSIKVIHFVRMKPWYDPVDQVEINRLVNLTDYPEEYDKVNMEWYRVRASMVRHRLPAIPWCFHGPCQIYESCVSLHASRENYCVTVYPSITTEPFPVDFASSEDWQNSRIITLVTQISFDRLWRLVELSREWSGPISVALWVPKNYLDALIDQLFLAPLPSRIGIHLVVADAAEPYPINMLRNIALEHSKSDMIFILDADFVPSNRLYRLLTTSRRYDTMWKYTKEGHIFVVPAFEFKKSARPCSLSPMIPPVDPISNDCYKFPIHKEKLNKLIDAGVVQRFHFPKKGHLATRNEYWQGATKPYYVYWEEWYEPYVILRKSELWPKAFHEQFVDRGHNKVMFIFELYVRSFKFVVLNDAFCVHRFEGDKKVDETLPYRKAMTDHLYLYMQRVRTLRGQFKCTYGEQSCPSDEFPTVRHFQPIE